MVLKEESLERLAEIFIEITKKADKYHLNYFDNRLKTVIDVLCLYLGLPEETSAKTIVNCLREDFRKLTLLTARRGKGPVIISSSIEVLYFALCYEIGADNVNRLNLENNLEL